MKFGALSDFFDGAGAKYLTEVELNKQHEFQGVSGFRKFLGTPSEKKRYDATFLWLSDDEDVEPVREDSYCTWSDVRRDKPDRPSEYHLYYAATSEPIVLLAQAGDLLLLAKLKGRDKLVVMLCQADTTIAHQLLWLFGLEPMGTKASIKMLSPDDSVRLGYAARSVLDVMGIELEEAEPDAMGQLIDRFGLNFPPTAVFSAFARDTMDDVYPVDDPDGTLIGWMDHEEALFRHLERNIVAERLAKGFMEDMGADVDGFISFSLSVQNRRKSRAGWAFGHHVEAILKAHGLQYKREATTEKRYGPDFLFPGESEYHDPHFNAALLTMLGAKTSCKDRWRQVLAEANRVETKHLITLQPGISTTQTTEMQSENLQLVVPRGIFPSYTIDQQKWLMDTAGFLELVKQRERQ